MKKMYKVVTIREKIVDGEINNFYTGGVMFENLKAARHYAYEMIEKMPITRKSFGNKDVVGYKIEESYTWGGQVFWKSFRNW